MNKTSQRFKLTFEWHSLFRDIWRNFILVILAGCIAFMGLYISERSVYSPTYTSTTTLVIRAKTGTAGAYTNLSVSAEMAEIFATVFQDATMRQKAAENIGKKSFESNIDAKLLGTIVHEKPHLSFKERLIRKKRSLLIGAVWIVLYAVLRQTVRTKEDVQRELNQTCVGVLPQVTFKRYKRKIDTNVLLSNPLLGNDFMESMRLLRSAVQSGLQENEKVILVSSTAPGEGKSVTTLNLAAMLAKSDGKILVIDGDLRNSGISHMMFPGGKSLQDSDTDRLYDIIRADQLGVDVLTFRTAQRRLWKIMRTNMLSGILSELRDKYDYILIDTPPCGIISDAAIMANVADVALYIVRHFPIYRKNDAKIQSGES